MMIIFKVIIYILSPILISISYAQKEPFWKLATKGMTKSSNTVITMVLLFFLFLILFLVLVYMKGQSNIKDKTKEIDKKRLIKNLEIFDLDKFESKLILELKKNIGGINSEQLFYEINLFEKTLLKYIKNKYNIENEILKSDALSSKVVNDGDLLYSRVSSIREKLDFDFKQEKLPLCTTLQLKKGMHVHIRDPKFARGLEGKIYSNNAFYFVIELMRNSFLNSQRGKDYEIFFDRDGQYKFSSTLLLFDGKFLYFSHTLDLIRSQFREYVRYETNVPIKMGIVKKGDNRILPKEKVFDGKIKDISGGGIKLNTTENIAVNDILSIVGKWDSMVIDIKVKVLRTKVVETPKNVIFFGFCQYVEIDKKLKESLIKHIFYKMREDLKLLR